MYGLIEDIQFVNGYVLAPSKPGLGYEIDWDLVKRDLMGSLE